MEGAEFVALSPVFGVAQFQTVSWIVCLGILAAWLQGFALGGNGAANDFSTTVGAGVLSLKKAMFTAAVFDIAGALTLGVEVSKTIASRIADVDYFSPIPTFYMVRRVCEHILYKKHFLFSKKRLHCFVHALSHFSRAFYINVSPF